MGKSWGNHGEIMGNTFGTTISWENHGECMGNAFKTTISWGNHGKIMGNPWGMPNWDDDFMGKS
jgi:hypothetical protein